jgi:hypothetical protein
MSPARSTILWNMLVSGIAHIVGAIDIPPIPVFRKLIGVDVFMRLRSFQELIIFCRIYSSASAFSSE